LPETEALAGRILSLPMYPQLTSEQQALVADTVLQFCETRVVSINA